MIERVDREAVGLGRHSTNTADARVAADRIFALLERARRLLDLSPGYERRTPNASSMAQLEGHWTALRCVFQDLRSSHGDLGVIYEAHRDLTVTFGLRGKSVDVGDEATGFFGSSSLEVLVKYVAELVRSLDASGSLAVVDWRIFACHFNRVSRQEVRYLKRGIDNDLVRLVAFDRRRTAKGAMR